MTTTIEPRPSKRSDAVIHKVAECLASNIALSGPVDLKEKITSELSRVLKCEYDWGGYNLAKTLEDLFHWSCDAELVGILEDADLYQSKHHSACVREWVKRNIITPKLSIGDQCKYLDGKTWRVGEVMKIDINQALYLVRFDSLGHVKSGEGTHGLLLPYEKVFAEGEVSE